MSTLSYLWLLMSAKKIFFQAVRLAKKQDDLPHEQKKLIKIRLEEFQTRLITHEPRFTKKDVSSFKLFKKENLDLKGTKKWVHFFTTTLLALVAALVIRQMWFELYKVPTGSMRPTIKELDHLTVSKLNFSLNIPFQAKHFYFNPDLVERSSICVFTSENMDVADRDTKYFYIIPGKKLLVKRLIAKPGDTLYFYGGKIYGIDAAGQNITDQLNPSNISKIDHIPFIQWLGEKELSYNNLRTTIYHMNEPFITFDKKGSWQFAIPSILKNAKNDFPYQASSPWGLDNYATARILNAQTKKKLYPQDTSYSSKGMYLELKHHLSVTDVSSYALTRDDRLPLKIETSFIPLDDRLAKKLFQNLYTARFEVKNGALRRYGSMMNFESKQLPRLSHIPDGTYEFYYGEAYKVHLGGLVQKLPSNHPIYRFSMTSLEVFFNLGIEFNTYFTPGQIDGWAPPRYSYYRDGDLFVMGLPFLEKGDAALESFIQQETLKSQTGAIGFLDQSAPLNSDGSLNIEKIEKLGLKIPDKQYFVLGDNHAQSADSRVFGFVPENNLKGCPDVIFWPFGDRFGHLPQAAMPVLNLPRSIVWSIVWVLSIVWIRHKKKRDRLPQDFSFLERD